MAAAAFSLPCSSTRGGLPATKRRSDIPSPPLTIAIRSSSTVSLFMRRGAPRGSRRSTRLPREDDRAAKDESTAEPVAPCYALMQQECGQNDGKNDAQFVHRGHSRRLPELQRPEVAEPRKTRRHPGQDEEHPGAPGDGRETKRRRNRAGDRPGEYQYDRRAEGGGEIRVDLFHAHLGEDGGESREERGEQRPGEPVHSSGIFSPRTRSSEVWRSRMRWAPPSFTRTSAGSGREL